MSLREEVAERMARALGAEVLGAGEAARRPPGSLRALVLRGTPSPAEWGAIEAALLPGALVALLPGDPEGEEAILAEEVGLEVWDAILVADDPRTVLPAAKATRTEKEAGLAGVVAPRAGHEAVKRKEGSAGVRNARAGAGRTAKAVLNDHPTVKSVGAVRAAMRVAGAYEEDAAGPVLDLFSGSGTTGVVCVEDGIPVVLVDKLRRYADLAAGRMRGAVARSPQVRVVCAVDLGIAPPMGENPQEGAPHATPAERRRNPPRRKLRVPPDPRP